MPVADPRFTSSRHEKWRAEDEDSGQWEYKKAALMFGIPMLLTLTIIAVRGQWLFDVETWLGSMLLYSLFLTASVVLGLVGLVIACVLFGDGAGPLGLGLLRLAAVFTTHDLIFAILPFLAIPCFGIVMSMIIVAGLIVMLFELDLYVALVAAIVTWLIKFGVFVVIMMMAM